MTTDNSPARASEAPHTTAAPERSEDGEAARCRCNIRCECPEPKLIGLSCAPERSEDETPALMRWFDAWTEEREKAGYKIEAANMTRVAAHVRSLTAELARVREERDGLKLLHEDTCKFLKETREERDKLARFALKCAGCMRKGCNVDGGDVQEWLVEAGYLVPVRVTEACDPEDCECACYNEFPQTCYRIAPQYITALAERGEGR